MIAQITQSPQDWDLERNTFWSPMNSSTTYLWNYISDWERTGLKTALLRGLIWNNSGVICAVASRWQKVTRKRLETTAGHPAGSQFAPQNIFCIQYGWFKVTNPSSKRSSSPVETGFQPLQSLSSPAWGGPTFPPALARLAQASSPASFSCRKS